MPMYFKAVEEGITTNDWTTADTILGYIQKFQTKYGADILPKKNKIDLEITYNKMNVISRLFMYYFILGVLLLVVVIMSLFKNNKLIVFFRELFKWLIILLN